MAKDDDFDPRGIEYILNMINEQNAQQVKDNNNFVQEIIKGFGDVKDEAKLSNKAMDAKTTAIINYFKKLGIATDKLIDHVRETNTLLKEVKRDEKKDIGSDIFATAMTETLGRAHEQSEYAIKTGGAPLIDYTKGGKDSDTVRSKLQKIIGSTLDKSSEKLMAFLGGQNAQNREDDKKVRKTFMSDFIDELGRSKLIGGTFLDTIKLLTYLASSWLSDHFGVIGRGIGIALIAAGPFLANLLGKAIGGVIKGTLSWLGNLLKGVIKGSVLKLAKFITGLGPKVGGTAAIGLGAFFGKEATDSWSSGHKGQAAALGASAIGAVVGGIGLLIGATFAPITVAVAAIAGAVTLTIKYWDKITGFVRSILEKLGLIAEPDTNKTGIASKETFIEDASGEYKGEGKSAIRQKIEKVLPWSWENANKETYKTNKYGAVTNFGKMTKENAWAQMEAYETKDPKKFNQLYERISKNDENAKYINFGSFVTDLSNANNSEIILGKGTMDAFLKMKKNMEEYGFDTSNLKITSGIGTFGRYSDKKASPHNLTGSLASHNSPFGSTIDFVGMRNKDGSRVTQKQLKAFFDSTGYTKAAKQALSEVDDNGSVHGHMAFGKLLPAQKVVEAVQRIEAFRKSIGLDKEEDKKEDTKEEAKKVEQEKQEKEKKEEKEKAASSENIKRKAKAKESSNDIVGNLSFGRILSTMGRASLFGGTDTGIV